MMRAEMGSLYEKQVKCHHRDASPSSHLTVA